MSDIILTTQSELADMILVQVRKALTEHQPASIPAAEPDRWMNIAELCEYLPDHPVRATVYQWVRLSMIPVNKGSKQLRFLKSEIDTWIKSGRRKTFAELRAETGRAKR